MKKCTLFLIMCFATSLIQAQPNCYAFLLDGDTAQYEACKYVEENLAEYYQFHRTFYAYLDTALQICPHFAYAYREKAAPYVKAGNFIEWKKNIDSAVKYDWETYLPIRASIRHKFFADHIGGIEDVNRILKEWKGDLPYSHNGTYHCLAIKALCFKELGQIDSAISTFELLTKLPDYFVGMYDYIHLGVLYMQAGNNQKAIETLKMQLNTNELAETHFYLAQSYKNLNNESLSKKHMLKARDLFNQGYKMLDPYNTLYDQIFLSDIEHELQILTK